MPGLLLRRCLALGLLGLCLAPSAGALAVGLHLALDHDGGHHHGDGDHDHHSARLEELAAAAIHGHHHRVDLPHHDHPAHLDAAPGTSPGPSPALFRVGEEPGGTPDGGHGDPLASRHRRSPPVPLFHAHCSLLL